MTQNTQNRLGTFGGVFTPSILTIVGVIMFMRAGYVIGEAGILQAFLILIIAKSITTLTGISISAVSTNTPVSGGGAYFLISRALGPEFGGAIGIALFMAQAISVPFYILGFTEALVRAFPEACQDFLNIALFTAIVLFIISFTGAKAAIKTQYIIMSILALSILAFMGGSLLNFSGDVFYANLGSKYTSINVSFWVVFALYFPAATGIMAGVNMSGDLENPGKSIPSGTFAAIFTGLLIYGLQILIIGGAQTRDQLISSSFETMGEQALFGSGFLITAGVFAATLSSGLGSFLGAPRVLQAVGRDNVIPLLRVFRRGSRKGDEPHRALVFTFLITLMTILWAGNNPDGGAFNIVASVVTMFFLYTYGMINLAAFVESFASNPSFRPRFKYYHWLPALAGGAVCAITALLIDPWPATVAAVIIMIFYYSLRRRLLRVHFGDARWGFIYSRLRSNLLKLANLAINPKNWRPSILVLTGDPEPHMTMIMYALWIGAERGLVTLVRVLTGDILELAAHRKAAKEQLNRFVLDHDFEALSTVVVSRNLDEGLSAIIQGHAIGPLQPNVVCMGWASDQQRALPFAHHLIAIQSLGMSLILFKDHGLPYTAQSRRIDIWWRGKENGSLMVIVSHLLTLNYEWRDAKIRLLRMIQNEEGREPATQALKEIIDKARIDADAHIVVSESPFADVLHRYSSDASVVFLGFVLPEEGEAIKFQSRYEEMLSELPTTLLFCSSGEADLMA
ncbi:MAG: amino acid permease [Deltaproteobacteria bacterium]|nr:amino acid permease [Deltaproteobacteria bacterium]